MVPRGTSSTADAYLTPVLKAYIDSFFSGFDSSLRDGTSGTRVEFMMSDGGLTSVNRFSGLKSIISGPAGGVVAMARTAYDQEDGRPVVSIDMGGTSSDVARFAGRYEQVFETTLAGVTIQSPQLDVNTVASGGSSRLFFRNGLFTVGPESASAHPGPVCYRKGGPLAITDANLITGHLAVEMFPKIFGPNEDQGLDEEASRKEMEALRDDINKETGKDMSVDEVAQGFIRVANETMCRPIRALTEARGYSTSKHILCCFGGAGGQHACSIARSLGVKIVMIHKYSSILSAYGMALADRVFEQQEPSSEIWDSSPKSKVLERVQAKVQGEVMLNLRYNGTDTALMTLKPKDSWEFEKVFVETYKQEFGFVLSDKEIIVDDIRVKGIGKSFDTLQESVHSEHARLSKNKFKKPTSALEKAVKRSVYFDQTGRVDIPIIKIKDVKAGEGVAGPAILVDETQTILIEPECEAHVCQNTVVLQILYEGDESLLSD
jgi:5-oxoprolinase (ATP-hydrolysing)